MKRSHLLSLLLLLGSGPIVLADEPALPEGLGEGVEQPALPAGLDETGTSFEPDAGPALPTGLDDVPSEPAPVLDDEPALPAGLDEEADQNAFTQDTVGSGISGLSGFGEIRVGDRTQDDQFERDRSITEARLQLDLEKSFSSITMHLVTDLIYDDLADSHAIHLEKGQGWLDLREANLTFTPADFMDVKIGRQILTWGTGDLLFINDLFPKDWQAFFTGRDVEYLKAPSDAIKLSFFSEIANLNLIYTPRFDADRFIDGSRISFFSPMQGDLAGRNAIVQTNRPDDVFTDDELALRLYRNFGVVETAFYAYEGFWKSPAGSDPKTGRAIFPELRVYGASLRSPAGKGIGNLELGYYDSREDRDGINPFINNSEFRLLAGYEQEIAQNTTMGVQYYLERMTDYSAYLASLPAGFHARDRNRHLFTLRLTRLTHDQNMIWSLFVYASPSDQDFYLRPNVQYKLDDHWRVEAGANLFGGGSNATFFGQFRDNTNLYGAIRYSF